MPMLTSLAEQLRKECTDEELFVLSYEWSLWAREQQIAPVGDEWTIWMMMAGRGFGKTRSGAEFIRQLQESEQYGRFALVGATSGDARDVMVEGESGLLAISPPWNRPLYEPSKRRLTWPNGAIATLYSAEEPERLRGPQHDAGWADEVAAWTRPETWDQLMFGMRLGPRPRVVATTTPKPTQLIREIIRRKDCIITRGRTKDNEANLAKAFIETVVKKYEGTRLGRQELDGELLEDVPGALWTSAMLEISRVSKAPIDMSRLVVGVDPAVSSHEDSDETGIVVVGRGTDDFRDHVFVLDDRSGRYPAASSVPSEPSWPMVAVSCYRDWQADRLVAEKNNGGDLVAAAVTQVDRSVPVSLVWASRGKAKRAEPIAMLWEQKRAHLVGLHHQLEDEMTQFQPDDPTASSPNRMDAMVWAATELAVGDEVIVL
jgi:phage terminase large subunit-like protein